MASASAPAAAGGGSGSGPGPETFNVSEKKKEVRSGNITAAKAVASAIRTSLGPKGMDKMIETAGGEVIITNDGATIMSHMQVFHPTAKMLVELSKSQDVESGDGTTSVVVLCGSLLDQCQQLLERGVHPTQISDAFQRCAEKSVEFLEAMALPLSLSDRPALIRAATTSLASKVVSQHSDILAPLAVDAVLSIVDEERDLNSVDLRDIKVVKTVGGTMEDTRLVRGMVFNKRASHTAKAKTRVENARVGLIQFHLSAPKTDMENQVVVGDSLQIDRINQQERKHILRLCKSIKASGCNVLLIQKSILRDAVNDLALHFLAKMGIMVLKDIERSDVEFICRTFGCRPVAHVSAMVAEKLGSAEVFEEVTLDNGNKVVQASGVPNPGHTVTLHVTSSNKLTLDEAERSLHDALCVVRSLVKRRFLLPGGGAPETELCLRLADWSDTLQGADAVCARHFAEALEVIPYTLAENCGMPPIKSVTELRRQHAEGASSAGLNIRTGNVSDMVEAQVVQPLLVTESAIRLSSEVVRQILKIDSIVATR